MAIYDARERHAEWIQTSEQIIHDQTYGLASFIVFAEPSHPEHGQKLQRLYDGMDVGTSKATSANSNRRLTIVLYRSTIYIRLPVLGPVSIMVDGCLMSSMLDLVCAVKLLPLQLVTCSRAEGRAFSVAGVPSTK